jgi:transcriptional regulator with XRE-family HTH domain
VKLDDYMKKAGLTDEQFAELIDRERSVVSRYRSGKVTPPADVIAKIEELTNYEVGLRDWLGNAVPAEASPT